MVKKSLVVLSALLLFFTVAVYGENIKILAIGNSFSVDAVEQNLYDLAKAEGITVIIGNMYIAGCNLETHLSNALSDTPDYSYRKIGTDGKKSTTGSKTLKEALHDEDWDYISFQQASPLSGIYSTYEASLPGLISYVKAEMADASNVTYALHQTWAYAQNSPHDGFVNYNKDQMTMYNAIIDAVSQAADLVDIDLVIPSGTAIQNGRTSFMGDNFNRDGFHLETTYGRYTVACVWFEKLFNKSVTGNTYAPAGLSEYRKNMAQHAAHFAVQSPEAITDMVNFKEKEDIPDAFVFVDGADGQDSNTGENWEKAKKTIDAALGVTGVTEIWIKSGNYNGITSSAFKTTSGVKIYGGFKGDETDIDQREKMADGKPWDFVNETIIDGQNSTNCLVLPALMGDNETLLDGIVFANGAGEAGAGLKAASSSTTTKNLIVQNCCFRNINTTTGRGGAIYLSNAYGVRIYDCLFENNLAAASTGSGMGGGAINLIAKDADNKISGCMFSGNSSLKGGALFLNGSDENGTEVSNCVFTGNSVFGSSGVGGAFHSENTANRFYNLLVANNEGTSVINLFKGSELYYSTIVKNKGSVNGGSSSKIENCIVWGNTNASGSAVTISSSSPDVKNNALYTSESTGKIDEEELTAAPGFVAGGSLAGLAGASENTDYSLTSSSPLLDKAMDVEGITVDIEGSDRPQGTADLGAYERKQYLARELNPVMTAGSEIYAVGKKIIVNTGNTVVNVFDARGHLVASSPSGRCITMNNSGYYVVKSGNRSAKVFIR